MTEQKDDIQEQVPLKETESAPVQETVGQTAGESRSADAQPAGEGPSLKEVIAQTATEDEAPQSRNFTLRTILGGDILNAQIIRRQIWLILLIALFALIYVANRYTCQKDLIEIDRLQKELQDAKYRALSSSSQLTERSRESHVLDMLRNNKDSVLKIPSQPPYIIDIPENE